MCLLNFNASSTNWNHTDLAHGTYPQFSYHSLWCQASQLLNGHQSSWKASLHCQFWSFQGVQRPQDPCSYWMWRWLWWHWRASSNHLGCNLDTLKWFQSLTDTLAQWVEHHMQSQKVAGSIPPSVTFPNQPKVRFINVLTGTAIYASLNNHQGIKQTCHDDLESLAYMLIYFLCGSLPWSHVKTSTKKECYLIMQMKLNSLPKFLGRLPNEFTVFLNYTCALGFEKKPDYNFLCKLLHDLCIYEGHQVFNWCSLLNTCLDDRSPSMRITKKTIDLEKDNAGTSCSNHHM